MSCRDRHLAPPRAVVACLAFPRPLPQSLVDFRGERGRERERERERPKEGIGSGVGILNAIFFLFLRLLQMGNWPRRDKSGEEKKKTALDRCRICGLDRRRRRERRRQQQEEEAPKSAVSKAARKLLRSESFDRRRPQEQSTLSPPHSADPTDRPTEPSSFVISSEKHR